MRVYNLTDVSTPALSARGLVGAKLRAGGVEVLPGGHADVPSLSADEQIFLLCGALAVGEPPAWYRAKKAVVPTPHEPTAEVPSSSPLVELSVEVGDEPQAERTAEPAAPEAEAVSEETDLAPEPKKPARKRKRGSR